MESGATAMRMSHYQQSDTWYSRCDRFGIVGWAEIPSWGLGMDTPEYLDKQRRAAAEGADPPELQPSLHLLLGHRQRDAGPGGRRRRGGAGAGRARGGPDTALDLRLEPRGSSDTKNWHSDVVASSNRYYGWYSKSVADFQPDWLTKTRGSSTRRRATRMSEFGAGASIAQHAEENSLRSTPSARAGHPTPRSTRASTEHEVPTGGL